MLAQVQEMRNIVKDDMNRMGNIVKDAIAICKKKKELKWENKLPHQDGKSHKSLTLI